MSRKSETWLAPRIFCKQLSRLHLPSIRSNQTFTWCLREIDCFAKKRRSNPQQKAGDFFVFFPLCSHKLKLPKRRSKEHPSFWIEISKGAGAVCYVTCLSRCLETSSKNIICLPFLHISTIHGFIMRPIYPGNLDTWVDTLAFQWSKGLPLRFEQAYRDNSNPIPQPLGELFQ